MIGARLANLSVREKILIVVSGLVLLVLAVDNLMARAVVRRVKEIGRGIQEQRRTLGDYREALRKIPQVNADFESVRERFEPPVSRSVAMDRMKNQIDEAAQKNGLKIFKMEDRERAPAGFYDECAIEIGRFEGDEKGLIRFINDLWSARGMLRVTKLNLTPNPVQGSGMVKGSMLVTKVLAAAAPAANVSKEQP